MSWQRKLKALVVAALSAGDAPTAWSLIEARIVRHIWRGFREA
jgi:hypothetical protein